jgi:hypothetical protein
MKAARATDLSSVDRAGTSPWRPGLPAAVRQAAEALALLHAEAATVHVRAAEVAEGRRRAVAAAEARAALHAASVDGSP